MKSYSLITIAGKPALSFNNFEYAEAIEEIISALSKLYVISNGDIIEGPGSRSCLVNISDNPYSITNNSYGTFIISLEGKGNELLNEIHEKIGALI